MTASPDAAGTAAVGRRLTPRLTHFAATSTVAVAAAYLVITLVMTWPLAAGLTRDVPGDLGDSLLNMWILGWGAEHVPHVLTGRMTAGAFWNANIFHPEPLALAFSEHLFGQVLQILPVYYLTENLILSYNLLFLSTFALSGLGMYLLVRDLLGHDRGFSLPAFVAGLIFAFVPYRIAQVAHIQSLSSQWMPLALYGFRRFVHDPAPRRWRALAGGSLALLMQNWSCGYYLIYFAPFVPLFVIHQIITAGRARDWRVWASFAGAAAVVALGTWPFLALYLDAQRVHAFERSIGEVIRFSADVYSYLTAPEALRLWGPVMRAYPKPEGELFFGVVTLTLVGAGAWALLAIREPADTTPGAPRGAFRSAASKVLAAIVAVQVAGFLGILFTGGFVTSFGGLPIRATNGQRILGGIAIASAILVAVAPRVRHRLHARARSPLALALVLAVVALWLSLGPMPQSHGQSLQGLGLYGVLYDRVPGFDGLRVPARYAMVATVFLAIAAGYGLDALVRRRAPAMGNNWRVLVAAAMAAMVMVDVGFAPMPVNQTWGDGPIAPPARVEPPASTPAVYRELARLDSARVVAEFPFGDPAWELRYVYYSTRHWKRLVNGYSGGFPQGYKVRVALFQRIAENPEQAWRALVDAGTTHAIVHEDAYPPGEARGVAAWLTSRGARESGRFGGDVLYSLPDAH